MTRPLQILIGLLAISACQHVPSPGTASATGEESTTADDATTGEASTGAAFEPLAGAWSLELGAELDRTCVGSQTPFFFPMGPYVLTNDGGGGFSLAYGAGEPAIHSCARTGVDFECPIVMIGGTCEEMWEAGFAGAFEDPTRFTAVAILRFTCIAPPNDTTGGVDCCAGFGDVDPCTLTHALEGSRTGPP